jgi:hypothetical protein
MRNKGLTATGWFSTRLPSPHPGCFLENVEKKRGYGKKSEENACALNFSEDFKNLGGILRYSPELVSVSDIEFRRGPSLVLGARILMGYSIVKELLECGPAAP